MYTWGVKHRIQQSLHIFRICSLSGALGVKWVFVCSYLPVGDVIKHLSDLSWILYWCGDGVWGTQGIYLHGLEALPQKVVILIRIKQHMCHLWNGQLMLEHFTTMDIWIMGTSWLFLFCDILHFFKMWSNTVCHATVISQHELSESRFKCSSHGKQAPVRLERSVQL